MKHRPAPHRRRLLRASARGALLVAATALAIAVEAPPGSPREPRTLALLINGGQQPSDNALSHLHHLQDMLATLLRRGIPAERIHVFSSDGQDPAADLVVRDSVDPRWWLVESTSVGGPLRRPRLTNTEWEGIPLKPATLPELRRWFDLTGRGLEAGDRLLVFVTDHGTQNARDPDNGLISLWNDSLSVLEFRALLGHLRPGVQVVSVMSQCYSGAFAEAMAPFNDPTPTGEVCGFYSTSASRPAYGCYAEGRDRDRIGHAFRFIDALSRSDTLSAAHREVLVSDTTPDVPIRTSDVYLERLLQREAERRAIPADRFADELLREAWGDRARWEPEIRLLDRLGETYGVFSPRSLAEFEPHIESLQSLSRELATYRDRWQLSLNDLRQENLARFLEARDDWRQRLADGPLEGLPDGRRERLGSELLGELESFTRERHEVWERMQRLRGLHRDAEAAEYRVEIRLAALLRMRAQLQRVAGKQLLERGGADAAAVRAAAELEACEAAAIGTLPADAEVAPPAFEALAPYEQDLDVVKRVLPSWFGIQFGPVPDSKREELDLSRGAVVVQRVYGGSAADSAGIRVGDFVVGPPGAAFDEPNRIREWIMTSPQHTPLRLGLLRDGEPVDVSVALDPYPLELPRLPGPPQAGDAAPELPTLGLVSAAEGAALPVAGARHLLFFWATWCAPCKASLPELLAWSDAAQVPVLAVSDEGPATVRSFLDGWSDPFPPWVATDELRLSYVSYGISGTPTFVLVDESGTITWRQSGYSAREGLGIDGWDWDRDSP